MLTLLKNAKIYDGTGSDAFVGDILLDGDQIAAVGKDLQAEQATILDLQGLSLAPGFLDAHSHNDWFAIRKDPVPFFAPFLRQGITTFVTGNCGLSTIGFEKDCPHIDKIGGGLFGFEDTTGCYGSASELFQAVDGNCPGNVVTLVGHCSARAAASGNANRPLTQDEEDAMLSILEKSLQEGAAGISLGLMYEPGLYADENELTKVAALCKKYNRPLTVHARANSAVSMAYPQLLGRSHLLRALDELTRIARATGVKLHYSHAIFVGRRSFKDKAPFISAIEALRAEGIDAMFDIYNEKLGVSVITVILPAWYQSMTPEEKKKPINRLKLSVLVQATSLLLGFGFNDIQVAYIGKGFEQYEGKSIHEIAKEEGLSDLDAYLMLCEKSNFKGRVNMGPYSTDAIISEFSRNENSLFMTDAWVEPHGIQNPAIYDCFPKFLRDALLGTGASMGKTIRSMTGATADRFAIAQRGYIREGYFADLVVFNEDTLISAVPDQTCSFGIEKVFLNGALVLDGDKLDEELAKRSGRALPCKAKEG